MSDPTGMIHVKVIYNGQPRNEGRFGRVEKGDELLLTRQEYRCVAENPDFTFVEEVSDPAATEDLRAAGNPTGPPEGSGNTGGDPVVKEPGVQAVSPKAADEEAVEEVHEEEADGSDNDPYYDWSAAELKTEIEVRNEVRSEEAQISTKGRKAALKARLIEDDES